MAPHNINPLAVDAFIAFIIKEFDNKNSINKSTQSSRSKLPCTYCGTIESTTWRPGPCGTGTLCNVCGVKYMDSGKRKRQIDLLLKKNQPMWVKKTQRHGCGKKIGWHHQKTLELYNGCQENKLD